MVSGWTMCKVRISAESNRGVIWNLLKYLRKMMWSDLPPAQNSSSLFWHYQQPYIRGIFQTEFHCWPEVRTEIIKVGIMICPYWNIFSFEINKNWEVSSRASLTAFQRRRGASDSKKLLYYIIGNALDFRQNEKSGIGRKQEKTKDRKNGIGKKNLSFMRKSVFFPCS